MNPKDITLHIDVKNRRLVRDFFSNLEIAPADLVQGDSYNVRLIGVEANPLGNPSRPWRYVALPTTAYVGIGTPGQRPASGTFTLTWGGDTTSAIAYNASAATVQTALNAIGTKLNAIGTNPITYALTPGVTVNLPEIALNEGGSTLGVIDQVTFLPWA